MNESKSGAACSDGTSGGTGAALTPGLLPINHEEARELATLNKDASNLARCYLDLSMRLSEAKSFSLEQRTADTLDAERYRYLRNVAGQYRGENDGPSVVSGLGDLFEHHFGPEVDDVLDEAMAAWKAAGSPLPKVAA